MQLPCENENGAPKSMLLRSDSVPKCRQDSPVEVTVLLIKGQVFSGALAVLSHGLNGGQRAVFCGAGSELTHLRRKSRHRACI